MRPDRQLLCMQGVSERDPRCEGMRQVSDSFLRQVHLDLVHLPEQTAITESNE